MGRLLLRALGSAGLLPVADRALLGDGLSAAELDRLRGEDILLVAGLADLVRAKFHGPEVRILSAQAMRDARESAPWLVNAVLGDGPNATGADFLREVALARLAAPAARSLAVSFDGAGLELAQTALLFGANVLVGDLGGKRTLPLLDGPEARRVEILGLVERAGRSVRFVDGEPTQESPRLPVQPQLHSQSEQAR